MNRTVILACSATKRKDTCELSALARYDGPAWRTLRANLTCMVEPPLALSAEFGLISAYQEIPDYDRKLDKARALELVDQVAGKLEELARQGRLAGEIFAFGGSLYRELLKTAADVAGDRLGRALEIKFARGGIGDQLGQLKAFLTRTPAPAIMPEDLEDELEELARAPSTPRPPFVFLESNPGTPTPDYTRFPRRCLVCAALNPCSEHSAADQARELARNDREIRRIRFREKENGR
jgi:hypothetical protein